MIFRCLRRCKKNLGVLNFHTDYSVTKDGARINAARVCCQSTVPSGGSGSSYVRPYLRYQGALLGTNDVVYLYADNGQGEFPSCGNHKTLAVWSDTPGTDFDVYVRCNVRPTETQWDYIGYSVGSQEFVHIPGGECTCPGSWNIAVHSYSGSGQFNLVWAEHYPSQHRNITAGTDFSASSSQMDVFENTLRGAARRFFGATEGTQMIARIDLCNNASCNNCGGSKCNLCFHNQNGTANSPICGSSWVDVYQTYHGYPAGIAHEWGHKYFCAEDEYEEGSGLHYCGHSIMNSSPYLNDFCYEYSASHSDHGKDRDPGISQTSLDAAWTQAYNAGVTPWIPAETPDSYNYENFDFNDLATVVVRH